MSVTFSKSVVPLPPSEYRDQLIVALISGQDVRKWTDKSLYEWAAAMADRILHNGTE